MPLPRPAIALLNGDAGAGGCGTIAAFAPSAAERPPTPPYDCGMFGAGAGGGMAPADGGAIGAGEPTLTGGGNAGAPSASAGRGTGKGTLPGGSGCAPCGGTGDGDALAEAAGLREYGEEKLGGFDGIPGGVGAPDGVTPLAPRIEARMSGLSKMSRRPMAMSPYAAAAPSARARPP